MFLFRAYIFTVLSVKLKNQQNNLCVEEVNATEMFTLLL